MRMRNDPRAWETTQGAPARSTNPIAPRHERRYSHKWGMS